jgi:hypothetical protein
MAAEGSALDRVRFNNFGGKSLGSFAFAMQCAAAMKMAAAAAFFVAL